MTEPQSSTSSARPSGPATFTRPFFIVNPKSAGGETGRLWDLSLKKWVVESFPSARWAFTAAEGQGSRLAALAIQEGADLVIAVGGDGTVNEVVNGLMGRFVGDLEAGLPGSQGASWPALEGSQPAPALAVIPRGTGCDFAKSIGIKRDFRQALQAIKSSVQVRSDIGEIDGTSRKGAPFQRYFINIAGGGANGEVVQRVNASGKQLGGFLSFFLASFNTTLRYHTPAIEIQVDRGEFRKAELNVIFVCNAQYCGAGMQVGKGAYLNDGVFQVLEVNKTSRIQSLLHGSKLYTGAIESIPGASIYNARQITLRTTAELLLDCDGEQPGVAPVTFRIIPGALTLCVTPDAVAVKGTRAG